MAPTRRELLGVAAASVAAAGCLGTSGDGGSNDQGSSTVAVQSHDEFGEILVDADGRSLYLFDADEKGSGSSACTGGCADAWPPLTVDGEPTTGPDVTASIETFEREDGSTQVAAAGWPLYGYASDSAAGDVKGQGVNDAWWLVGPDGAKVTEKSESSGRSY